MKNIKWVWFQAAIESAVAMNDMAIIVDLLGIFTLKPYVASSSQSGYLIGNSVICS